MPPSKCPQSHSCVGSPPRLQHLRRHPKISHPFAKLSQNPSFQPLPEAHLPSTFRALSCPPPFLDSPTRSTLPTASLSPLYTPDCLGQLELLPRGSALLIISTPCPLPSLPFFTFVFCSLPHEYNSGSTLYDFCSTKPDFYLTCT